MEATGERFIPNAGMGPEIELEHMHRYYAVAPLLKGKSVLDAACGVGYGSQLISQYAETVTGIDIDLETIEYAKQHYSNKNVSFRQMSIDNMNFDEASFDAIVSFETLEHVPEKLQRAFLHKASCILKENGFLVISTPDLDTFMQETNGAYHNPFHTKEYNRRGFQALLKDYFPFVQIFGQKRMDCSIISGDKPRPLNALHEIELCDYLIAVCSSKVITVPLNSIFLPLQSGQQQRYSGNAVCTIYWDLGQGYTEASRTRISPYIQTNSGECRFHVGNVPQGCRRARFDPALNQFCIVSNLHMAANTRSCSFVPLNGTQINGVIAFSNTNPQIEVELPKGTQWLEISATIQRFTSLACGEVLSAVQDIPYLHQQLANERKNIDQLRQSFESLEQSHKALQSVESALRAEKNNVMEQLSSREKNIMCLRDSIANAEDKICTIQKLITEKDGEIVQAKDEISAMRSQLVQVTEQKTLIQKKAEQFEDELQQMTAYARHVEALYHQLAEQYNTMAGSRSWRITAPVRCALDWIKSKNTVQLIRKGLFVLRTQGLRVVGQKVYHYMKKADSKRHPKAVADSIGNFSTLLDRLDGYPDCTVYLPEVLSRFDGQVGGKVLLVSHELNLTGAPIALYYFAQVLKEEGYCPFLIAPKSGGLVETIVQNNIPVIVYKALLDYDVVHSFAQLLDFVVANTIVTAPVVMSLDGAVPVLWWIHEAEVSYSTEHLKRMPHILPSSVMVCAGGSYAHQILLNHRPNYKMEELLYYVPDRVGEEGISMSSFTLPDKSNGKTVFCCIGMLEYRKGQDIVVEAIERLPKRDLRAGYFVFVGRQCYPENYRRISSLCSQYPDQALYIEELSISDLGRLEQQMDCLICASRDDPMPIVVTEALQFSKLVICSEHTGSAQLLTREAGGLVYHDDDPQELANCISQVMHHGIELSDMKMRARKIYDRYFSKAVFYKNVLRQIGKLSENRLETHQSLSPLKAKSLMMEKLLQEYDDMREPSDCAYLRETLLNYDQCPDTKRVLLLSHEFSMTGAPIALQHLAQCFRAQGAQVVIFSQTYGPMVEELTKNKIPAIIYCKMYEDNFLSRQAFKFDLVVLSTVATFLAIDILKDCDIPILWWIHDSKASYSVGGFRSCLPKSLPKKVQVFCGGEYAREQLLTYYPNYSAEILLYMVPDFLEQTQKNPPFEMKRMPGKMVFTVIGQQDYRKGHDILAQAIRNLTQTERNKAQFYFVGAHLDHRIQKAVDKLCAEFPEQVMYIPNVSHQDCFSIERQSDCIVCSSRDDPLPIFVAEAMMLERTVICSEHTGWAPIIEREGCGLLYHNDDPEELAEQMRYVLNYNQKLDAMRARGRNVYCKQFSEQAAQGRAAMLLDTMALQQDVGSFDGTVSVIIPTYNAGAQFDTLLRSLKGQRKVRRMEIIVVDSDSSDETRKLCRESGVILIPISHEEFSHSFARNRAAQQARGDILIFMTQDALPQDDLWMNQLITPLSSGEAAAVSCRECCPDGTDLYYAAASWEHSKFQGIQEVDRLNRADAADTPEKLRAKAALNDVTVAIRTDVFKNYFYRLNYAEDLDMGLRLLSAGYAVKLLASTSTIHGHNRPAGYYLKRGFVETIALGKICDDWKAPSQPDEVIARKLLCGNSLLQKAITMSRLKNFTSLSTQAFFASLLQSLAQVNGYSSESITAMNKGSKDPVLNWCLVELAPLAQGGCVDEKELFHHVCYYLEHILREYMLHKEIFTVNQSLQEEIYCCIEKQFCLDAGSLLGRLDESSKLYQKIKRLEEGV